jgi:hypothetical protein
VLRFPIPLKLLVGFAANLALLALGFFVVFRAQFGSATNELFTSIAEPRVQAVVQRLGEELRGQTRAGWEQVLAEASQRTGVEFSLFDGTLHPVAGPLEKLPAELESGIRRTLVRGRPPQGRFEDRAGPGRGPEGEFPEFPEFHRPPPPGTEFEPFPPPPPGGGPPPRHDHAPPLDPAAASYP